jgi:regulator of RNase E activity RraA
MPTIVDPRYFEMLRRFDTPTVLNAIELFDVQPRNRGFLDARIRSLFPRLPPIVGYASTATFRSAHAPAGGDAYSNIVEQVERFERELPRPRIVVFQDLDDPPCGASFGEVMATIYQSFGCVGMIASGAGRDLDQVEKKGFACFASAVVASHAYCRLESIHVPVTVGGCLIHPGDVIHADQNGVAVLAPEHAPLAALACERVAAAEQEVLGYLSRERSPTADGLAEAQKRMRRRFAEVAGEVRRELGVPERIEGSRPTT